MAGFPNLHQLVGPNTALGHNSIIFMIEAQVNYVLDCMRAVRERGADYLVVDAQAQSEFNARLQDALEEHRLEHGLQELVPAGRRQEFHDLAVVDVALLARDPQGRAGPVPFRQGPCRGRVVTGRDGGLNLHLHRTPSPNPMDLTTFVVLALGFAIVAGLYSSVGHAGASGYLALMALAGVAPEVMRPTALVLNVVVAASAPGASRAPA